MNPFEPAQYYPCKLCGKMKGEHLGGGKFNCPLKGSRGRFKVFHDSDVFVPDYTKKARVPKFLG